MVVINKIKEGRQLINFRIPKIPTKGKSQSEDEDRNMR